MVSSSPMLDAPHARARDWIASASLEISARDKAAVDAVARHFAPGTEVAIAFLPGQAPAESVAAATALRRAGLEPMPHIVAGSFTRAQDLSRFLEQLSGEAGVGSVVAIRGDAAPSADAPYPTVADMVGSGVFEANGIDTVTLAGHPEGISGVDTDRLDEALAEKVAMLARVGIAPRIATQFVFDAAPLLDFLDRLARRNIAAPVRIGVAGPTNPATLMRYAAICGVGSSMKFLKKPTRLGRMAGTARPDAVVDGLARAVGSEQGARIAGLHIYPFGGIGKTADWRQGRLDA